jgi:hypothetical protein
MSGRAMTLDKLVQLIREEFEEAPDLRMTLSEAARFWGLDLETCERVLSDLLVVGFLSKGHDDRYASQQVRLKPDTTYTQPVRLKPDTTYDATYDATLSRAALSWHFACSSASRC